MIIYLQMIESDEDKSKFEQLYIMYKGLMFHVAMKILKNEFDAEDAVHQAFLSLIENLKKISDVKCPKTRAYIVIITERKILENVNGSPSSNWDVNDSQFVYDLYNGVYDSFEKVSIKQFLLADQSQDRLLNSADAVTMTKRYNW